MSFNWALFKNKSDLGSSPSMKAGGASTRARSTANSPSPATSTSNAAASLSKAATPRPGRFSRVSIFREALTRVMCGPPKMSVASGRTARRAWAMAKVAGIWGVVAVSPKWVARLARACRRTTSV